jgi:glycosyltransferase involved in cell wall biosynthesis
MKPRALSRRVRNDCSVTVITATHNRPEELKSAITSVLNQTFKDFEYIIINDGNIPETKKVVESFKDPRLKYYHYRRKFGCSASFNGGLRVSKGKYISFLDDDDIYYPDHLEIMVNALERSKYSVAYSTTQGVRGIFEDGSFKSEGVDFVWDDDFDRRLLLSRIYIGNLSLMIQRDVFCDVGMFYEKPFSGDWEMWLRISRKNDFLHVHKITGEYRIKTNNITILKRDQAYFGGIVITAFHRYECGQIAFIKHYLSRGKRGKAKDAYDKLKKDYVSSFRTTELIKELLPIAREFRDWVFVTRLSAEYFRQSPRGCIRALMKKR